MNQGPTVCTSWYVLPLRLNRHRQTHVRSCRKSQTVQYLARGRNNRFSEKPMPLASPRRWKSFVIYCTQQFYSRKLLVGRLRCKTYQYVFCRKRYRFCFGPKLYRQFFSSWKTTYRVPAEWTITERAGKRDCWVGINQDHDKSNVVSKLTSHLILLLFCQQWWYRWRLSDICVPCEQCA